VIFRKVRTGEVDLPASTRQNRLTADREIVGSEAA